ncbi:MAG: hypothetical protein US70_C0012G0019 [Parcubacteria group bacterium GW2011_GWD2_38_11]|nr:MAG: hypothetical protein US70_C0012G0019 [Parcubacteria group bacterium GW2011_GWD2_38_11]
MKNSTTNALEFFILCKNCFLALFTKILRSLRIDMSHPIIQANIVFLSYLKFCFYFPQQFSYFLSATQESANIMVAKVPRRIENGLDTHLMQLRRFFIYLPQQFLYFLPLPHKHRSFLPILSFLINGFCAATASLLPTCSFAGCPNCAVFSSAP